MSESTYTETYRGFEIEIYQEQGAENPFEDQGGLPPIAVLSFDFGRGYVTEYATQYGSVNDVPTLTRAQILANGKEILSMLDTASYFRLIDRTDLADYSIEDLINDAISEHIDGLGNSDRLEALASLYNMAGMPAVVKSIHGYYSQGDYAEILAVATPEFIEATGNPAAYYEADGYADLKRCITLFEDWAFGNVYGYEITDQRGEYIDGCGMYFGDYDAKEYGALSEARARVDELCEAAAKDRVKQLKLWIKNRVPFQYRHFAV